MGSSLPGRALPDRHTAAFPTQFGKRLPGKRLPGASQLIDSPRKTFSLQAVTLSRAAATAFKLRQMQPVAPSEVADLTRADGPVGLWRAHPCTADMAAR